MVFGGLVNFLGVGDSFKSVFSQKTLLQQQILLLKELSRGKKRSRACSATFYISFSTGFQTVVIFYWQRSNVRHSELQAVYFEEALGSVRESVWVPRLRE